MQAICFRCCLRVTGAMRRIEAWESALLRTPFRRSGFLTMGYALARSVTSDWRALSDSGRTHSTIMCRDMSHIWYSALSSACRKTTFAICNNTYRSIALVCWQLQSKQTQSSLEHFVVSCHLQEHRTQHNRAAGAGMAGSLRNPRMSLCASCSGCGQSTTHDFVSMHLQEQDI